MAMTGDDFVQLVCRQLLKHLVANDDLIAWTDNSDLKGAYAEATVRQFIQRFITPMRLSCGSIAYEGNCGGYLPQLDAIIWQPSPLPAALEVGDFAIVPRSAAVAFLEIKRSNYSGVGKEINQCLQLEDELIPVIEGKDRWGGAPPRRALGVICLHDDSKSDAPLAGLLTSGQVAALLRRKNADSPYVPDTDAMLRLSNFLMGVRRRAAIIDGQIEVQRLSRQAGTPVPARPAPAPHSAPLSTTQTCGELPPSGFVPPPQPATAHMCTPAPPTYGS